jgi:flagellar basal-body rod modification protein FlgD
MNINPLAAASPATSTPTANAAPDSLGSDAESMFMSLLVTELKAQDPTAPMDPTAMVGQMLSMNQLNELISINKTLQTALGVPSTASQTNSATSSLTGAH